MPRSFGHPAVLLAAALCAAAPAHAARQDGLVLYLNFDNEAAPLANSAPNSPLAAPAKIGDALGMTFVPGRFGKAALFTNGPDNTSPTDWAIDLGKLDAVYEGSFTVAFWAKIDAPHRGVILANKDFGSPVSSGFALSAASQAAQLPSVFVVADSRVAMALNSAAITGAGKWHHWALVVNRKTDTLGYFVDGKPVLSRPIAGTKLDCGLSTIIGAGADGRNGSRAAVDDVGIWSRALTDIEISALGKAEGKRIPEPSTYAAAAGAVGLVLASVARRRRAKRS